MRDGRGALTISLAGTGITDVIKRISPFGSPSCVFSNIAAGRSVGLSAKLELR